MCARRRRAQVGEKILLSPDASIRCGFCWNPPPPFPSLGASPELLAAALGVPHERTAKATHAHLRKRLALTLSPLSSAPRPFSPFVRSLLTWQARTARAPSSSTSSRRKLWARPSQRWRWPLPPSVQASAVTSAFPSLFLCVQPDESPAAVTSQAAWAAVLASKRHLPVSGWYHGGWDRR